MIADRFGRTNSGNIWIIEGRKSRKKNPYIGDYVKCTWLRRWGNKPKGFSITGKLLATFCANSRALIGEVELPSGKVVSCPWSKRFLSVERVDKPSMVEKVNEMNNESLQALKKQRLFKSLYR